MTTREALAKQLTELASSIEKGCIVELGSYHGKGTVALAREAKVPVYSIDDFRLKHGWIGEKYEPSDEEIYWQTVADVDVIQLKMSFEEAVAIWEEPIGLLYWDPGMTKRFELDFTDWSPHVVKGGVFIAKDTAQGHLGTRHIIDMAVKSGVWHQFDYWMGVSFLRRMR